MAGKSGKSGKSLAKKKKMDDGKSSQRSSSSIGSKSKSIGSKKSQKLIKSTKKPEKSTKKSLKSFRTIYKSGLEDHPEDHPEENFQNLTISIMAWFQGAIALIIIISAVYQLAWGQNEGVWIYLIELLLVEIIPCIQLIFLSRRPYIGSTCLFLTIQYVLLFSMFSYFLHTSYLSSDPILERFFCLSTVSLIASALHFFIIIKSMHLMKESKQRADFSGKVIVEGVEKRRKDLFMMISDLITEICCDDRDLKVNLTIKDEEGHPKSMRGAGVEAGVSRVLEMTTDGDRVNLSSSNTALAMIQVPKHKHSHHHHHHHKKGGHSEDGPEIDSKYNKCTKQGKMLSPRKILQ